MKATELIKKVNKLTKSKKVKLPKLKKKKEPEIKPNWERIISLSVAGQYIQNQLSEELKNVKAEKR